jgi:hypothetical protein
MYWLLMKWRVQFVCLMVSKWLMKNSIDEVLFWIVFYPDYLLVWFDNYGTSFSTAGKCVTGTQSVILYYLSLKEFFPLDQCFSMGQGLWFPASFDHLTIVFSWAHVFEEETCKVSSRFLIFFIYGISLSSKRVWFTRRLIVIVFV